MAMCGKTWRINGSAAVGWVAVALELGLTGRVVLSVFIDHVRARQIYACRVRTLSRPTTYVINLTFTNTEFCKESRNTACN